MPTWVDAPENVLEGSEAEARIAIINDGKYYSPESGVLKADLERWQAAQAFERHGWLDCWNYAQSDRNHEHYHLFDRYKDLPSHLGKMVEIGCGPFTQSATILHGRTVDHITLLDPLINDYLTLQHCSYRSGGLPGIPTVLLSKMAEEFDGIDYDTVVCINVLEHTMDALLILNNIHRALKVGGLLVMGERTHDEFEPHKSYDVGHPIVIKTPVLQEFKRKFAIVYENGDYFIGRK